MKGHPQNRHINCPSPTKQATPPPGTRQTTAGNNGTRRPSSPLPDTSKRGGQSRRVRRRDERDERRAAAGRGKPNRTSTSKPLRMNRHRIRHRHDHDDIIGQASRENGQIISPRPTTRVERGARRVEARRTADTAPTGTRRHPRQASTTGQRTGRGRMARRNANRRQSK